MRAAEHRCMSCKGCVCMCMCACLNLASTGWRQIYQAEPTAVCGHAASTRLHFLEFNNGFRSRSSVHRQLQRRESRHHAVLTKGLDRYFLSAQSRTSGTHVKGAMQGAHFTNCAIRAGSERASNAASVGSLITCWRCVPYKRLQPYHKH
jgi:hypothetical protein